MTLETFNTATREAALAEIRPCLDIARWVEELVDARPFADGQSLLEYADEAAEPFTQAEIDGALAHHPRIGEKAKGNGAEATMSAREQAGLGASTAELEAALRQGNTDYEAKFDRVFLIRAAGRDRAEILAQLRQRINNSDAEELSVVGEQLREIALLRLETLFDLSH